MVLPCLACFQRCAAFVKALVPHTTSSETQAASLDYECQEPNHRTRL